MPTVLVVGPPCAGKTTYVAEHANPGDTIIDYDTIAQGFGSPDRHQHSDPYKSLAQVEMDRRIAALIEQQPNETTWLIRSMPDQGKRKRLARQLQAEVVLLDPGRKVCMERAQNRPSGTSKAIGLWYWRNRVTG